MSEALSFTLSGVAVSTVPLRILDEMCEHFVEHAEVERNGDFAFMRSKAGTATLELEDGEIRIELACPSQAALQNIRTSIAEHMFYFAGEDPFELSWSQAPVRGGLPNLREAQVVRAEDVTPFMRRVWFTCGDVTPYVDGDMHVRLVIPPRGREPVWPGFREDGRIAWPQGEDALVARAYTIRAIDRERGELCIDFVQHPAPGVHTPGADFARDAKAGDRVALLGPGSGHLPAANSILLIGDESALPAIARIAEEVPAGTQLRAIIEIRDAAEEQALATKGTLDLRWLHRHSYPADASKVLFETAREAIEQTDPATFVWVACEKEDVRAIRSLLKKRGHDRKNMYAAWYWER